MKFVLLIVALILVAVLATVVQAYLVARSVAAREAALAVAGEGTVRDDLPEVVRAYAERGMLGAAPGGVVRLTQDVEMVLRPDADWQPMRARQVIGVGVPGFVWVATMAAGPLPVVRVVDTYGPEGGLLDIRVLGAWRMGATSGAEADVAEAARYLAELPWSPDAILLNRALQWAETDAGVEVAMETRGGEARVVFTFDEGGDIVRMTAKDRPATQPDGSILPMDWEGRFTDYGEIGGRRIPRRGEVGYIQPDGYAPYWRGTITSYSVSASALN